jgi:hypothetical protein
MFLDWVIVSSVIGDQECPPLAITVILVTTVENIGVKEEGIPRIHIHLNKRKNLYGIGDI